MKNIEIRLATEGDRPVVTALLKSENLPVEDLPASLKTFFLAEHDSRVVGVIGLEEYGADGLLRSLVVNPLFRNENIAARLLAELELNAKALGIGYLYLLTETAPGYFAKKGFDKISRSDVPALLQTSSEFSHVCPQSATVMRKRLQKKESHFSK
jgi:amino-acid N-acetyltransferase